MKEIQEVRNAFKAYETLDQWNPYNLDDMLAAHALLMFGLVDNAGHWRSSLGLGSIAGNSWCTWHRHKVRCLA